MLIHENIAEIVVNIDTAIENLQKARFIYAQENISREQLDEAREDLKTAHTCSCLLPSLIRPVNKTVYAFNSEEYAQYLLTKSLSVPTE